MSNISRELQLYHFGAIYGLVDGIVGQLMKLPDNPIERRVKSHNAFLDTPILIKAETKKEQAFLEKGYNDGILERIQAFKEFRFYF